MKDEIDIKKSLKKNWLLVFICILIPILTTVAGFYIIRSIPREKKYISVSEFEVINGEESLNLYQGVYHRITTFEDVASVLRSNEVLEEVMRDNNIDITLREFRRSIDLYETGDMVFRLEILHGDKENGEKVNLSVIENYLTIIESRMDNDNKALFDVKIVSSPVLHEASTGIFYKLFAAFLFGFFCVIIIILIVRLIRLIAGKKNGKK
jgi:capsular polysaccharide biosynthesis protein